MWSGGREKEEGVGGREGGGQGREESCRPRLVTRSGHRGEGGWSRKETGDGGKGRRKRARELERGRREVAGKRCGEGGRR